MVLQDDDTEANIYRLITLIKWAWVRETGQKEQLLSNHSSSASIVSTSPSEEAMTPLSLTVPNIQRRRVSFSISRDKTCTCCTDDLFGHTCTNIATIDQEENDTTMTNGMANDTTMTNGMTNENELKADWIKPDDWSRRIEGWSTDQNDSGIFSSCTPTEEKLSLKIPSLLQTGY